jgi:hypothetical protein
MKDERSGPWEDELRQGLDAMTDLGAEQPPNLADLQLMVAQVQAEQRRTAVRDLLLFWTVALVLLTGGLYLFSREPVFFLALQGVLAVAMVGAGLVWAGLRGRVTE